MRPDQALEAVVAERRRLASRVEEERERLERWRQITEWLSEQLTHDEALLREIDEVLGRHPQLSLEASDLRLRGRKLEEVAVRVLSRERGPDAEVHYRDWYQLLRAEGYVIAGKDPLNTFLTQISRSEAVARVGKRTGRYRLVA